MPDVKGVADCYEELPAKIRARIAELEAQVREPLTTEGWRLACLEARERAVHQAEQMERMRELLSRVMNDCFDNCDGSKEFLCCDIRAALKQGDGNE